MAEMILVGSKLPHSVYLEIRQGNKTERVLLAGMDQDRSFMAPFFMPADNAVGLTQVPRDFWEAWVKEHQDFAPYRNGFIFASRKKQDVFAEVKEKGRMRTGFERINSDDIPNTHQNTEQMVSLS